MNGMRKKTTMEITTMENNFNNPFSMVKNTREVWSKSLEQNVREVQVQFADEEPAWIPYTTLLAMQKTQNNMCL